MPDSNVTLLTAFLTENDQPCPQCGYNLRNLQGHRCPECGEELALRVNAAESRQKLLITGLIGLSAGAGWDGLLMIYIFYTTIGNAFGGPPAAFWTVLSVSLIVQAAAIYFWLKNWKRIRRLSTQIRFALAAGCWMLTMIDVIAFGIGVK